MNATGDRYAAKLLFQFRVQIGEDPGIRRLCEERTVVFRASSAHEAISTARSKGKNSEYDYENSDKNRVYFECVGIRDMIHLGGECDEDEVWYDIFEKVRPMERSGVLTMTDDALVRRITGGAPKDQPSPPTSKDGPR